MRDNPGYQRQYHILAFAAWGVLGGVRGQKEPYRSPYEHAPIGLEPGLRLQVIERTVELGHPRQREPHMDHRRRCPFWTAHSLLRRGRFGGQPLASWAVSRRRG
jgi:hypothetical protein